MKQTLREAALETRRNGIQPPGGYEIILEQVRGHLTAHHADELASCLTMPSAAETIKLLISAYLAEHDLAVDGLSHAVLCDRLYADMVGFGFLDRYITDEEIEEINGNSWRDIEVVTRSGWRKIPERFLSPQHAEDTLRKMVRLGGMVLDGTKPLVDSYITEGIRISAMIPPVADRRSGAAFSLRRQRMARVTKEQLVDWGAATPEMLDFLVCCINHGVSVGLAGRTGSGKTTDISFLLRSADRDKRIYTIEETRELDLLDVDSEGNTRNRVIHTCTRPSELDSADVDMNELLRKAMRFSPDIIAVAEMRGAEAMVAQDAARTGHAVVTSLHANSARKAYGRILSMCQMSDTQLATTVLLGFVVEAFPIMAYKRQFPDGTRRTVEIVEATGIRDGVVQARTLFHYEPEGNGFVRDSGISDALAAVLLANGAILSEIKRFREVSS